MSTVRYIFAGVLAFYYLANVIAYDILKVPYATGPLPDWADKTLSILFAVPITWAIIGFWNKKPDRQDPR